MVRLFWFVFVIVVGLVTVTVLHFVTVAVMVFGWAVAVFVMGAADFVMRHEQALLTSRGSSHGM